MDAEISPKVLIQRLAERILAGEEPPKEEMRLAIAALRENRATAIATAASRGSKKSSSPPKDVNVLLSNLGF